jgi:hypothetical protein
VAYINGFGGGVLDVVSRYLFACKVGDAYVGVCRFRNSEGYG